MILQLFLLFVHISFDSSSLALSCYHSLYLPLFLFLSVGGPADNTKSLASRTSVVWVTPSPSPLSTYSVGHKHFHSTVIVVFLDFNTGRFCREHYDFSQRNSASLVHHFDIVTDI